MTLLTADDVLTVKFEVSSFKKGYRQNEVNVLPDNVTTTIREFEERLGTSQKSSDPSLRKAEILLTAGGIRNIQFSTARWLGYRIDQVDALIVQVLATMEALEAQVRTSSFAGRPDAGASTAYGRAYGSRAYGVNPAQTGYAPNDTDGASDAQYAEVAAQRDQYIAQLQRKNAYLRTELESARYRLGTTEHQGSSALRSPRLWNR